MSNYAFLCSIKEFKDIEEQQLIRLLIQGLQNMLGESKIDPEQKNAYISMIGPLKKLFNHGAIKEDFQQTFIVFEYRLPFSNERIDLIIFGKNENKKPTAIVFELKGWQKTIQKNNNLVIVDNKEHQHPELQVLNYTGKLKFSHSTAKNFDIKEVVWMYNLNNNTNLKFNVVQVFYKDQIEDLARFLNQAISSPLEEQSVYEFLNGEYMQSHLLLKAIKENFEALRQGAYDALCALGFGPSEEQIKIIEEIIEKAKSNEKLCYLINGAPGSGKSYIAVLLLLRALSELKQNDNKNLAVLGYRNNRLINTIKKIFSECRPGLDSVVQFYSTGLKKFPGLAEKGYQGYFKLVIYDEAQRMKKENIRIAMQRGDITVFFYDEKQILNAEEE